MLKIAIIGTGGIANAHIKGYLQFSRECKIVALCDIYKEKAEEISRTYSLNANIYTSIEELLDKEDINALSICTPPFTHMDLSIKAMRSGVHVLCEKPLAPSVEECDKMIEVQEKTGMILSTCHQNRFRNDIRELKHVLDSGLMGKILFSRIDSFWWRALSYYDLWWRGTWEKEGGGCILNHAVHHIDLMLWFLGNPENILSFCTNLAHHNAEVEDFGTAVIEFKNSSIAQFTGSVMCHGEDQQLLFQCEKGKISTPWELHCSHGMANGFPDGQNKDLESLIINEKEKYKPLKHEGHAGAIGNFLGAVHGREKLLVSGIEGKNTIEIITLFYQSSKEGRKLEAKIEKDNPWYTYEGLQKEAPHYHEKLKSVENFSSEIVVGTTKK